MEIRFLPCHSVCTEQWLNQSECVLADFRGFCQHHIKAGENSHLKIINSTTVNDTTGPFSDTPRTIIFPQRKLKTTGALRFSEFRKEWKETLPDLNKVLNNNIQSWENWLKKMPKVPNEFKESAEMAWFILWNNTVKPKGLYTRNTILVSKGSMNQAWAWDNCFHALAVIKADPELAIDQLRLFFDHQSPAGELPDPINDFTRHFGYVKPPVYGWAILHMIQILGEEKMNKYIAELYNPVAKMTDWWFNFRKNENSELCTYLHGNDAGWDNATAFDQGFPTIGPDLAAHLVLQMEALSVMAGMLGKKEEEKIWKKRSEKHLSLMLDKLILNNRFQSPLANKNNSENSRSLINYIPIELGNRLPKEVIKAMTADLSPKGPFLTKYGLATQDINSSKYEEDSYWRGPIWAPSTYLVFTGLLSAGNKELAKIIAERFCKMCSKDMGMHENYGATTGQGLRCPGFGWTAAVFILLAEWLADEK